MLIGPFTGAKWPTYDGKVAHRYFLAVNKQKVYCQKNIIMSQLICNFAV